ncbi:MAG: bifunctional diaminohydroxyphosphoribosylaminopyrimidine deaminase/5-amino-6-(5-phosphoribosylamino)uracil reductase RibD [Candidatus Omnitrophica bacterium]|nr:bifunctional diaminohydroxyphosphoribosylaminopyrimidine deaminase/5-amino-6-(5-phosphoribosylamino)uracil reductase RibD [Candidatus Omnitrophota bacterium]MBU1871862.1 bifunctional diaminohydroxyphosphoribosylaminopyrimidine deaminase/5-amino-6-(5-phosphoribosylamino)uracil reductase RibD [Candidatus Omnitrophota bacterium]
MAAKKKDHLYYMDLAMHQALRAEGKTYPNPLVGAVVVKRNQIIARGYHKKAGLPHAEIVALSLAGKRAAGASLYVTLEPCSHFGRTPPCTDTIIKSRVKEVIIGMLDPNPVNNGKGIEILRRQGIEVKVGFLEDKLKKINEAFIKCVSQKLPFVTVKVGQSLDGKIATYRNSSQWITSELAREYVHRIRDKFDAIMVGVNTILRDNPNLQPVSSSKRLTKIIVDSNLSISHQASVLQNPPVIIATLKTAPDQETPNRDILANRAQIIEVREKDGQVNLRDMMKKLAGLKITSILVEGGGTLIGSLFDEGLVDKVLFFISPKIIGGKDATSSVMGRGVSHPDKAFKLKDVRLKRIGEDFLVEGRLH